MRIRTIKPEFFRNDKVAELNPLTRILFQGLWCIADRRGRLEDRPKRIKVEILPYDNHDIDAALNDLAAADMIVRYNSGGTPAIQIVNFEKHQRITGKEAESESAIQGLTEETKGKQSGNIGETPKTTGMEGKGMEGNTLTAKAVREVSENGLKFADWFKTLLPPNIRLQDGWRTKWAELYDELIRIDKRTKDEIKAVCQWARKDEFWSPNFLSPMKLRKSKDGVMYFDLFQEKMKTPSTNGQHKPSAPPEPKAPAELLTPAERIEATEWLRVHNPGFTSLESCTSSEISNWRTFK